SHLRLAVEEVELGHRSGPSLDPISDLFLPPADAVETKANSRREFPLALEAQQRGSRQPREADHLGCSENVHEHPSNCMMAAHRRRPHEMVTIRRARIEAAWP